jgi:hypothetical protein
MTALDSQIRATGLVNFKAVVDHAIEHGLPAPSTIELTDRAIRVWLVDGKEQWGESIHVDQVDTRPSVLDDRVLVYADGRLPFMNLRIQLAFSREQHGGLRAVTA